MAHYHCSIKTGGKGAAADHADYIAREGRFADEERYGRVVAKGVANMPEWAREEPAAFWRAADTFERENGNTYREFELALPRELERDHQIALMQRFIESELGGQHAYQWALHLEEAADGGAQPHVHVMFSDRIQDGIERGPEQYFKRGNRKSPEKGGCLKKSYGEDKAAAAHTYVEIRQRWAEVQNLALEARGIAGRVDHRSLASQGIREREPGLHQGPAVAGIEGRGEKSRVAERQRQQIAARQEQREKIIQAGLKLERERRAAERAAARERRQLAALAAQAPPSERAAFERQLESDRREQLERAEVAAQRRLERREEKLEQAKPAQRLFFTRLVAQGRALQERLGHTFTQVKDWVQARIVGPWSRARSKDLTLEERRAQGREQWLAMRAETKAQEQAAGVEKPPMQRIEEERQQAVNNWLAYRAMTPEQREAWDLERQQERDRERGQEHSRDYDGPELE